MRALRPEDVIPTGLLNAFRVERRSTTLSVAEEGGDSRQVRRLGEFQVTLDDGLCRKCNGDRLGGLEQLVQPILVPMAVRGEHVTVGLASQRLLAVWAIKTVLSAGASQSPAAAAAFVRLASGMGLQECH